MARGRRSAPARSRRRRGGVGLGARFGLGGLVRAMVQPRLRPPTQRELDVLGLGLVAFGVFLGFVLYGHGDGGWVGQGLADALAWLLGTIRYVSPVALVLAGGLAVMRPVVPSLRPFWVGGLCLFGGLTLALAANAFGLAPAGARHGFWHAAFFEGRGGILGEALYWASSHLASNLGSDVLAVFLLAAGVPLITGASIAGALRATGHGVADTTRVLRRSGHRVGDRWRDRAADWWAQRASDRAVRRMEAEAARADAGGAAGLGHLPPEPDDAEPVVRATHVEAPPPTDEFDAGPASGAEPEAERFRRDDSDEPGAKGVTRAGSAPSAEQLTPRGRFRASVTDDPEFEWRAPDPRVLRRSSAEAARPDTAGQERVAAMLLEALGHHGIEARVVGTVAGPHITRYELQLKPGIKLSRVAGLKDDLAYSLAATEIRILAPIPGKQAVGVEVPNDHRRLVHLGDVFQEPPEGWSPLSVWLGKDVSGRAIGADLTQMPHLLLAGTTGSGKSATINAMLSSVLLRASPREVRIVLVDPKQVELNHYEGIPHLLTPVITSPRMAANALGNLVREMEARYGLMSMARMRNLPALNRVRAGRGEPELPYVLCVIDELADLMMVAPADVEDSIIRLAQKARAVGIHLVLATQSPRVDVITGMIKANVPSRIAFAVSSQTDSRVILDHNGAESLLGQGDMLFSPMGSSKWQRIQGAYVDEAQIAEITDVWRDQGEPEFKEELLEEVSGSEEEEGEGGFTPDEDPLLEDAIRLVVEMGTASTSMLQRRMRLGYTRAGRLIDMLDRRGIISGYEGSKPRQVLVSEADLPRVLALLAERDAGAAAGASAGTGVGESGGEGVRTD